MTIYLLNSPVITDYGTYTYSGPIKISHARDVIAKGFVSAIGHQATAELLSELLSAPVALDRTPIRMAPGDRALIFRLLSRIAPGEIQSIQLLRELPYEFGLMHRLD